MREKISGNEKIQSETGSIKRTILVYLIICLAQLTILVLNYREIDIKYPLTYSNGDDMAVFFYAKSFDEFHINIENPMLGGQSGFNMYDYPYSDTLSFLAVKAIGLFTDNPFLIINLFYFLCSFVTALIAYTVIQKYVQSIPLSACLGLLYANSYFFAARYGHIWLIPYFFLPVACSLAIDIIDGTLVDRSVLLWKTRSFYKAVFLAFCCAFTGLYYAYFSCALFAAAMVIRWISTGKLRGNLYPICLILGTGFGVFLNIIPNLVYWMHHGMNTDSELAIRNLGDAEQYGLKIIQMILPRPGHRLPILAKIAERYNNNYPLVNENMTASIGIIASVGLLIGIIWLFGTQAKKTYSYLIISVILIATIGGISSMISLVVSVPVRCYNRMSLIIMFLSLLCVGVFLEKCMRHRPVWISVMIAVIVLCIGVFDQTQTISPANYSTVDQEKTFVEKVEANVGADGYVFELPYVNWPSGGDYKMFTGYLFSRNLHWSYGAMQGRAEADWQQKTAALESNKMVEELLEHGYDGIYVDVEVYEQRFGKGSFHKLQKTMNQLTADEPLVSENGNLYFWNLHSVDMAKEQNALAA